MGMSEKIKIVLVKRDMTAAQLAEKMNCSSSNLYNKLKRDNFAEKDLARIADILDCKFEGRFILNDTKETI